LLSDMSMGVDAEDMPHICPRREHNHFAPVRSDTLHCYGVDFLSNKEVLEIFSKWQPQAVEWLDDSSCNVVLASEEVLQRAFDELKTEDQHGMQEPWMKSKKLSIGGAQQAQKQAKARRGALKELCLQLRPANEADRKDPTHSGHTDSVYYEHVKEKQEIEKQEKASLDLRRQKKRQRMRTPKETDAVASQAAGEAEGTEAPNSAEKNTGTDTPAQSRLGFRGLLDPLLFMRAPGAGQEENKENGNAVQRKDEDLREALKRAEAEYAAILPGTEQAGGSSSSAPGRQTGQAPRRGREGTPGRGSGARARTPGRGPGQEGAQQRGKKRRPVEQEPRPVSEAAPPQRQPEAHHQVEAFLKENNVRCRRYALHRTFRAIVYGQTKSKKDTGGQAGESGTGGKAEELPPWEQYLQVNTFFSSRGQFLHTVAWQADDRRILAVVPHPSRVDVSKLARAIQKPESSVKQCKLKDLSKDSGFPVFVCPPVGHPKDAQGRLPVLLVDSSVVELKRPVLFDCGTTGICLPVSEFLRSTGAACVEGLAKAEKTTPAAKVVPTPEPAPEPAPIAAQVAGANA